MNTFSQYIKLQRRYSRSVNLERDLAVADSVLGYVPTTKATDTLGRFLESVTTTGSMRAWTLTGVYGTGKSAFAHFLASLCAPNEEQIKINALSVARDGFGQQKNLVELLDYIPEQGLIRAVVTSQREPISYTVVRALHRGATMYWNGAKNKVQTELRSLLEKIENDEKIDNQTVITMISKLGQASGTGILLIIDELGKNLEYAAHNQSIDDLYLLQQIAELPSGKNDPKVFVVGLLHQAFADYASGLTISQRNEWGKIQGRFEDIPFKESPGQVMRLIGHAINFVGDEAMASLIKDWAFSWKGELESNLRLVDVTIENIQTVYPLHPLSTLILPTLCNRYAQNDRSLFTFLTSNEPNSFSSYLNETVINDGVLPTLKLYRLYDYFIENGISVSSRPQHQRWVEIQGLINDARNLDDDIIKVLKTIGVLNLISTSGSLRATKSIVTMALCDRPDDKMQVQRWEQIIDSMLRKSLITWRKQVDELRIWEGSDFEIEEELSKQVDTFTTPIADLLKNYYPLRRIVAQRHSYKTGTLRIFERRFIDSSTDLSMIKCGNKDDDGVICYWVGNKERLSEVPISTIDNKPLIVIASSEVQKLKTACIEYAALKKIDSSSIQLQSDGVARREVRQRIILAKRLLESSFEQIFDVSGPGVDYWVQGQVEHLGSVAEFNSRLSDVCDIVYSRSLVLWNELLNRRELTSQGAKARKDLIEAMLKSHHSERLSIEGYGPEYSMYASVLEETGVHYRIEDSKWGIKAPEQQSGIYPVWHAIEQFCYAATDAPVKIDALYDLLEAPPYGVKKEVIPVLLLAVLLAHPDEICFYNEGSFLPKIGAEHFELLVKKPARFAVKHIQLIGLRSQVFKELETLVRRPKNITNMRNNSVLGIVSPLVQFANSLNAYTKKTTAVSSEAIAVRKALLEAREPDGLLFKELPVACGLKVVDVEVMDEEFATRYRNKLVAAIQEINGAYNKLLEQARHLIHQALGVRSKIENLREDLSVRSTYLLEQCLDRGLKRFIKAASNPVPDDKSWLEALVMIVADKPAESWNDIDVAAFEFQLVEMARKFKNLEALQKEFALSPSEGFTVRRITITRPDGEEVRKMVYIDREEERAIEEVTQKLLDQLSAKDNEQLTKAVAMRLIEKVLETPKLNDLTKEVEIGKGRSHG